MPTGKICFNIYLLIKYKQICFYFLRILVQYADNRCGGDGNMLKHNFLVCICWFTI
jgi:hypothetical protein